MSTLSVYPSLPVLLHQQSKRAQAVAHQGDHRLCVHLGVGAPPPRPQPKAPNPLTASCLQVAPSQPELGASKAAWELCAPHQVSSQTALRPPHSWMPAYWRAHLLRYSNKTIFDHGSPNYNMGALKTQVQHFVGENVAWEKVTTN